MIRRLAGDRAYGRRHLQRARGERGSLRAEAPQVRRDGARDGVELDDMRAAEAARRGEFLDALQDAGSVLLSLCFALQ